MKQINAQFVVLSASAFVPAFLCAALPQLHARPIDEVPSAVRAITSRDIDGLYLYRGGFDTMLSELSGNYFSGTTRLNGSVAYSLSEAFARGLSLDDCDQECMDKEIVGTLPSTLTTRVTALFGLTDNLYNLPKPADESSAFGGIGIRWMQTIPLLKGTGYIGANLENYYVEESPYDRPGSDNYLKDFTLDGGFFININPSVGLAMKNQLSYSSFGSIGAATARPGLHYDDYFRWNSETLLHYRLDGKGLNDNGYAASTGLLWSGFNENRGDYGDYMRCHITQELAFQGAGGGSTYYLNGRAGITDYRELRDYEAEYFGALLGIRGLCGSGATYDLGLGIERWNYDYSGLKDRTTFRAEGSLNFPIDNQWSLRLNAGYGIQSTLPNLGPTYIDAEGFRGQLRVNYQLDTKSIISAFGEVEQLNGNVNKGWASEEKGFQNFGIEYRYTINDNLVITPSLNFLYGSGDDPDSDAIIGTLRTTFTF